MSGSIIPLSKRPVDWFFLAYFILHIPITLGCDIQILFDSKHFPAPLVAAMDAWIRDYDDVLSREKPLWFQCFIVVELLFHVPYFFAAAWAFIKGNNSIRTISIVYATAVIASMVPILPEAWARSSAPLNTKIALCSVYAIWLIIPILLLIRVWPENVFTTTTPAAGGKKKQ